ncbi:SDR family oxidoreductase [Amycolatopsis sp. NPDC051102]|uniref:SDR family oxidoreductase n=1 Tax=Amycolatopsis sp. NPDC051102 TaxID=3155163 RepID=UPI00341A8079
MQGRGEAQARRRLDAAFESGDEELGQRYRRAIESRLTVPAGDIGKEQLGQDAPTWTGTCPEPRSHRPHRCSRQSRPPYEQLFGSNVRGTAEVIRLAVTGVIKPLTYLSTAAIAFGWRGAVP